MKKNEGKIKSLKQTYIIIIMCFFKVYFKSNTNKNKKTCGMSCTKATKSWSARCENKDSKILTNTNVDQPIMAHNVMDHNTNEKHVKTVKTWETPQSVCFKILTCTSSFIEPAFQYPTGATEELAHWSLRGSINLPHLWGTQHPLPRLLL